MSDYEVDVLVNGKPIKQFRHKGTRFIEGRKGSDFEIRFKNNTWRRVEVVASVDGLSVISGKPCGTESEGYLVPARESVTIPGWRLNNDAVAKFVFNDKSRSYTAQMGHGKQNAGVIGFMVFEEEYATINIPMPTPHPWPAPNPIPWPAPNRIPWPPYPWPPNQPYWTSTRIGGVATGTTSAGDPKEGMFETESNADDDVDIDISQKGIGSVNMTCDSLSGNAITGSSVRTFGAVAGESNTIQKQGEEIFALGTGWGSEQAHHVDMVDFTRNDPVNPTKLLSIYYDTRKGLENRGVKVVQTKKKKVKDLPNAFPTYSETGAKPPPGWKGKKRR